jgi:hypothetical protein
LRSTREADADADADAARVDPACFVAEAIGVNLDIGIVCIGINRMHRPRISGFNAQGKGHSAGFLCFAHGEGRAYIKGGEVSTSRIPQLQVTGIAI